MRDLLDGELHGWPGGTVPGSGWPERLRPAIGLPGFAAELRELLLRAAERGLGPDELQALGERHDVPEWVAAGRFFRTYEQVVLLRGAVGPGRAAGDRPGAGRRRAGRRRAGRAGQRSRAARRRACPGAAPPGRRRPGPRPAADGAGAGAGAHGRHRRARGRPGPGGARLPRRGPVGPRRRGRSRLVVLGVDHRARPAIRLPLPGWPLGSPGGSRADAGRPAPTPPMGRDGQVHVRVFGSAAQEAAWIADGLRRAHLQHGVPWSQMAVLSRSARRSLPVLRRALLAAGVPIAVPPDELPLARQPAVVPLLMVLRYAARPDDLDADAATALLTSPLGSADPLRLRRLRRGLLRLHAAGGQARGARGTTRCRRRGRAACRRRRGPSRDGALDDGGGRGAHRERPAAGGRAARRRPRAAGPAGRAPAVRDRTTAPGRGVAPRGGSGHPRGRRCRAGAVADLAGHEPRATVGRGRHVGGPVGAGGGPRPRRRSRAVRQRCPARRPAARRGRLAFVEYLGDQQLPADTLAARAPDTEAVALLTAHAAAAGSGGSWPYPVSRRAPGRTCGCGAAPEPQVRPGALLDTGYGHDPPAPGRAPHAR